MEPLPIVEPLNIVEDRTSGSGTTGKHGAADLSLERGKEAFHHRVIPTIPFPAHTQGDVGSSAQLALVRTRLLAPTVAVMDEAFVWSSPPDRVRQCPEHQFPLQRRPRRPSDHLAREQVDDDGQIQPPFGRWYLRDVRNPGTMRRVHRKLAIQDSGGHRVSLPTVGGTHPSAAHPRHQSSTTHQPCHLFATAALPLLLERGMHARAPIRLPTGLEHGLYLGQ
jgi:hypothetical protein